MTIHLTRRQTLAAFGAATAAAALPMPAFAKDKANVGVLRLTSHAPNFVAFERGYFAEEGLDVEFKIFAAAQPMAVAIASGDADFGVTAISGGLISLAEKGATKVIGGALQEAKGISGQILLASNKAYEEGVTSPKALKGRKIGITTAGSSFHYMAARMAEKDGVPASELRFTPLEKIPSIVSALKTGDIDAWAIQPSIGAGLVSSGAAKQIGLVADYLPDYQVTTVFTSSKIAADDKAKAQAFLRAFAKGAQAVNAALVEKSLSDGETKEILGMIHKYVFQDQPAEKAYAAIQNGPMQIAPDCALRMGSIRDQLDWFKSEGMVKAEVTMEMLVDPSFVKNV